MNDSLWMSCSVKFSTGYILRQNDPVEIYNSRLCRGRFRDAEVDTAFNTLRMLKARGGDDPRARPVIVIHCGRLHVVEARCLTTVAPRPPAPIATESRPAKQKALF